MNRTRHRTTEVEAESCAGGRAVADFDAGRAGFDQAETGTNPNRTWQKCRRNRIHGDVPDNSPVCQLHGATKAIRLHVVGIVTDHNVGFWGTIGDAGHTTHRSHPVVGVFKAGIVQRERLAAGQPGQSECINKFLEHETSPELRLAIVGSVLGRFHFYYNQLSLNCTPHPPCFRGINSTEIGIFQSLRECHIVLQADTRVHKAKVVSLARIVSWTFSFNELLHTP
jgi:hypothetical protein